MYKNIKITGIGTSYPPNECSYNELEKHFKNRGIRIKSLMTILGKEKRYSMDENTNYFGLLMQASQMALDESNMNASNIDMIVVVAETPEHISPTNAMNLAYHLNADNVKIAYDLNGNCAGGVLAIDQVSRYLESNEDIQNALIVNAFMGSYIRREEDPISFSTFSDSSSAIMLEKKTEDWKSGFLGSEYRTNCSYIKMDVFPSSGFQAILTGNRRSENDVKLDINSSIDLSFIPDVWSDLLNGLLKKNQLSVDDISNYIFSQFSLYHIVTTMAKLKQDQAKAPYVGQKYGYNGGCSPIFALNEVKNNLKAQDYIILCGIGAGYLSSAVLYKI